MLAVTGKFVKNAFFQRSTSQILITCCAYSSMKEHKIEVKGQTLNYIQNGNGPHKVLCFPGALGTIWSDFKPQIQNLDTSKFTVVAWDPPGYGHSRPPNRKFTNDFYEKDADIANEFMQAIGIPKFSILGWSDGGISGMILAAKYPNAVEKLVTWGSNAYIVEWEYQSYEKIRDVSKWSARMKEPLVKLYGSDGLQDMWSGWCDAVGTMYKNGGDICKKYVPLIQCPTFILHGDKDPLVAAEHPQYLIKYIKNSRLHRFPDGKHNIHLKYADEFNALVTAFLLEQNKM